MDALKQYLELYDTRRESIDRGSAGALNGAREAARKALEGKHLPERGEEGYEKTSINEMFEPDYGVNIDRLKLPCDVASAFKCGVPNVSSLLCILVNDRFVPTNTLGINLPEGVKVMSLEKAAREFPELVDKYYGSVADMNSTATALNTLLAQDGVFIHVARGVKVEKPLQIVALTSAPVPMLSMRRILIVAEAHSSFSILNCDHTMSETVEALASQVVEVVLAENAHVDICEIEDTGS